MKDRNSKEILMGEVIECKYFQLYFS